MRQSAAIYARYSSHAQDGGTSIEVQVDFCRRSLSGQSVREYEDRARSGQSMAGREALLQLLADAEAGQITQLYVYNNTARLADAVVQALAEANESLAAVATPAEMRDFVESYVGPMVLHPDGTVSEKQTAPDEAGAGVKRSTAEGRSGYHRELRSCPRGVPELASFAGQDRLFY